MNFKVLLINHLVGLGLALGCYVIIAMYLVLNHGPVWMAWPAGLWLGWSLSDHYPVPQWIKNLEKTES